MLKIFAAVILSFALPIAALASATPVSLPVHNTLFYPSCCLVVAHSGGGFQGHAYTNSKEALDANYALERRVFEVDFDKTRDGAWVLTHAWHDWAEDTGWNESRTWLESIHDNMLGKPYIPTKAEFLQTPLYETTPLTLEDLIVWLVAHPDARVIVDTQNNMQELFDALQQYPQISSQFVFQAYTQQDLEFLKQRKIPLTQVIFSNYKINLPDDALVVLIQRHQIGALALNLPRALTSASSLHERLPNTPIYVHGKPESINSLEAQFRLKQAGVSGFYVD